MKRDGFRVEMVLSIGTYAAYTSKNKPVTMELAEAYSLHLEKNQCGGRIVSNLTEKTIKTWKGKYPLA